MQTRTRAFFWSAASFPFSGKARDRMTGLQWILRVNYNIQDIWKCWLQFFIVLHDISTNSNILPPLVVTLSLVSVSHCFLDKLNVNGILSMIFYAIKYDHLYSPNLESDKSGVSSICSQMHSSVFQPPPFSLFYSVHPKLRHLLLYMSRANNKQRWSICHIS